MNIILLSGGSGRRLWPLSNDSRSKQFLKVLKNENRLESMVQRICRQLKQVDLMHSTVIATSKSQVDMIHSQLGNNVPLIIEPERRDTFPAIALAATFFYSEIGKNLDDVVVVLPVDSYADISFFERLKDLEDSLIKSDSNIALMGVNPTYPSEKYGYIVPKSYDKSNDYFNVDYFIEKPTENEAKNLIKENALWNCGIFAFKLDFIISMLKKRNLPSEYKEIIKEYNNLEKVSFDYAVVEKTEKIIALSYNGSWKDLGTWNTLTEEMSTNKIGKGIVSDDSINTHLINELDIPVAVLGIENAVVAVSPDGILVSDKMASPKVKELITDFDQRPMFEERRWGSYRVLDYTKFEEGNEVLTKRICVKAGKNLSYQVHDKRSEVWTIIKGDGEFALDGEIRKVKAGDVLIIPVKSKHAIKAITDLEFIEVQHGQQLIEEDITRIYMTWEEIEKHCKESTFV